jgi:uncharacterized delta-60 repeat protein
MRLKFYILLLIAAVLPTLSQAQLSALDPTFDTDGISIIQFGASQDEATSIAVQADGKILLAGHSNNSFALARFNTDGSLDNSFDTDGKVTTSFWGSNNICNAVAVQNDGKILVAGYTDNNDSTGDFAIARFNTDGSLDNTFDTDGKVTTDFGGVNDNAWSMVIQSDGKIIVAGTWDNTVDRDFSIARYNTNGSLDTTFSLDGKVNTDLGGSDDYGRSVTIQNDGKIIMAGFKEYMGDHDFALVRYNADGTLDNSFDTDGVVITAFGTYLSSAFSVTVQPDGKIVAAGEQLYPATGDFALARYNSDGSLDNTFDTDGMVTTDFGALDAAGRSVRILSDGKIFVGGVSGDITNLYYTLVRYNADGSLDGTFDFDGKVSVEPAGYRSVGSCLAIQTDGKAVMGGWVNSGLVYNFAAMRFGLNVTTPAGIEENNLAELINIYPNPASGWITLSLKKDLENASFKLVNATGETVIQKQGLSGNILTLDLSAQAAGVYFICLETGTGQYHQKIIKQ